MQIKTYTVTCKKCQGNDELRITQDNTVYFKNHFPIIAARFRPDMKWGFECGECGNDSRVSFEEKNQLNILVRGAEITVKNIASQLKRGNENKFEMEPV